MTIELKDGRYLKAFMTFAFKKDQGIVPPKSDGDFFAALYSEEEEGRDTWHLIYRFRYYVDDKIHDSDDKKSWHHGLIKGDENEIYEKTLEGLRMMAIASFTEFHHVVVDSDKSEIQMEKLVTLPGMNLKTEGDA